MYITNRCTSLPSLCSQFKLILLAVKILLSVLTIVMFMITVSASWFRRFCHDDDNNISTIINTGITAFIHTDVDVDGIIIIKGTTVTISATTVRIILQPENREQITSSSSTAYLQPVSRRGDFESSNHFNKPN